MLLCIQKHSFPPGPSLLFYIRDASDLKVPNLVAQSQINTLSVLSSPAPSSLRKTAKCITFCDPLIDLYQPCSIPLKGLSGLRKTASLKVSFKESASTINGTQGKSPSSTASQPIPALKQHVPYTSNLRRLTPRSVFARKLLL